MSKKNGKSYYWRIVYIYIYFSVQHSFSFRKGKKRYGAPPFGGNFHCIILDSFYVLELVWNMHCTFYDRQLSGCIPAFQYVLHLYGDSKYIYMFIHVGYLLFNKFMLIQIYSCNQWLAATCQCGACTWISVQILT